VNSQNKGQRNRILGCRGKLHSLKQDSPPVVDVNGKSITLLLYKFDVYDQQRKVLASRTQYSITLSFVLTVHRAQVQTLEYVDVDCASFFATGQLGVAIGLALQQDKSYIGSVVLSWS
jgi:hypothetical protein